MTTKTAKIEPTTGPAILLLDPGGLLSEDASEEEEVSAFGGATGDLADVPVIDFGWLVEFTEADWTAMGDATLVGILFAA